MGGEDQVLCIILLSDNQHTLPSAIKTTGAESWSKKSLKSANLKCQKVSLHFNMAIQLQNLPKETLKNRPNIRKPSESKACLILRRMPWRLDKPGVSMQNASDPASTLEEFVLP